MQQKIIMTYQEIQPPAPLDTYIDAYWFFENTGGTSCEMPILPDCCMDIIYDLSNDTIVVWGVMTTAQMVKIEPHHKFFGIRFVPGALPGLIDVPAMTLRDYNMPLQKINARIFEKIVSLRNLNSPVDVSCACNAFFAKHVKYLGTTMKLFSYANADDIYRYSVKDLSEKMDMSVRHTERLFARHIGLTPKHFLKIRRFQNVHHRLQNTHAALATISAQCGYADQSHMNKEYKQLTSATPTSKKMSHFYKN